MQACSLTTEPQLRTAFPNRKRSGYPMDASHSCERNPPDIMKFLFIILASLHLLARPTVAAPNVPTSEFTSTDTKKGKPDANGGYLFPGQGPYRVVLRTGDDRSWLDLIHEGQEIPLASQTFEQCPGQKPWKANAVVQWRGYRTGKGFSPYAIIFRMYSENPNGKKPYDTLVVVKLDGANTRVVGNVPGSAGNTAAETMADKLCRP